MSNHSQKVAVVTGASRGVGRGIVDELAEAGFRVYATGRTIMEALRGAPENVVPLRCDHTRDEEVASAFRHVVEADGRIDVLVNNVWGGSETTMDNGQFVWGLPFWKQRPVRWDSMFAAGVRAHYIASMYAAPVMVEQGNGLIINLSYWAAQKFLGDVPYGVAKAATDKLTSDMSCQLIEHKVAAISLYPGLVRTEEVMKLAAHIDLSNSESPRYVGRAVVALARDPNVMAKTGQILTTAHLGQEYGFSDLDGQTPRPMTLQDI